MLGMGSMEILVILLLSFLLLGPQKMISGTRMLGDLLAEAKRFAQQIPHIDVDNSNFNEHKEKANSDLNYSDSQVDSDPKAELPIAFGSRKGRNTGSRSSDFVQDAQSNSQQADTDDESEKIHGGDHF